YMARQFAGLMAWALERIDDWLAEQRDRRRFRMRDMQPRTLQTLFGVDLTFRHRRYLDRQTGKMVYLLDEVLQLPAQKQLSPAQIGRASCREREGDAVGAAIVKKRGGRATDIARDRSS